jgi:hypothetical protein
MRLTDSCRPIASELGFAHALFQLRGPFPVEDSMGMAAAIVIVQRSLARGRYGPTVHSGRQLLTFTIPQSLGKIVW